MVTADGENLHCTETENPELLWCARGAGPGETLFLSPNLTEALTDTRISRYRDTILFKSTCQASRCVYFEIHLQDLRVQESHGLGDRGMAISKKPSQSLLVSQIAPSSDPGNEIVAVGFTPPGIDEPCIVASAVTFQSSLEAAIAALEPFNSTHPAGAIVEVVSAPTSIAEQYVEQNDANPLNHRYCAENAYVSNDADVAAVLEKAFTTLPHRKSFALWFSMAPGSRRNMPDMAMSMQSDHYFALYTVWESESDDERCRNWVRDIMKDVAPSSVGAYLGDSDFQQRRTKFWTDDKAERLMMLRRKWDPKGVVCGYLDAGDRSQTEGLDNKEWTANSLL